MNIYESAARPSWYDDETRCTPPPLALFPSTGVQRSDRPPDSQPMSDTTPRRRTDEIDPIVPEFTTTDAEPSATRADGGRPTPPGEAEPAAPLVPDLR